MKTLFFSPPLFDEDKYSELTTLLEETFRGKVYRTSAFRGEISGEEWLGRLRESIVSCDILIMVAPWRTLAMTGSEAEDIARIICEKLETNIPAIVEFDSHDLIDFRTHDPILNRAKAALQKALDVRLHDIRVAMPCAINDHPNEYSISIVAEDGVSRPDYLDHATKLHVNMPMLLTYDRNTYPLVEAPQAARFIDGMDLRTTSIPGVRPTIIAYQNNHNKFRVISAAGILHDGYNATGGFYVNGCKENGFFVQSLLREMEKRSDTFETKARRAYEYLTRIEMGLARLLQKISGNDIETVLTSEVRRRISEDFSGGLSRITLLDMLECIRSRSGWPRFSDGMSNEDGEKISRKEFSSMVDKVSLGGRNIIAHPVRHVLGGSSITEEDIRNFGFLDGVIWRARQFFDAE